MPRLSMKFLAVFLHTICLMVRISQTIDVSYSELEELDAACPQYNLCSTRPQDEKMDSIPYYSCQCGETCATFGTCCIDSPYINFDAPPYEELNVDGQCEKVPHSNISTYLISSCASSYRGGSLIKSKCENPSDSLQDPMSLVPVTSLQSEITYKNYFCAVCNNDQDSLEMWKIAVSPEENDEIIQLPDRNSILKQLRFSAGSNEWGITMKQFDGSTLFLKVYIDFYVPSNLKHIVKPCVEGVISDCHSGWRTDVIHKKCGSYMAVVYLKEGADSPPTVYRNIHCAVCNYESYSGNVCKTQETVPLAGKPPLSFTLVLDVKLSDGDRVGEVNHCKKGQIFDSFFNKCRTLTCALPGYVIKKDKCVRA